MVKHTQTIRRQEPTNCLNVFDHIVGSALKGLTIFAKSRILDVWQGHQRDKVFQDGSLDFRQTISLQIF